MRAIVYMGTGCDPATTKIFVDEMKARGVDVKQVCWTKDKPLINAFLKGKRNASVAYTRFDKWNTQKGNYDFAFGHSAGGFPLSRTSARWKIALNPPFGFYSGKHKIFRGRDDWLLPSSIQSTIGKEGSYEFYDGGHSTVPKAKITKLLDEIAPPKSITGGDVRSRRRL